MLKKGLRFLLFVLLLAVAAVAGYWFLGSGGPSRQAYAFIPPDFVYLVESDEPVPDWQGVSNSEVWKYLKKSPWFGEITSSADYLDSLLNYNPTLTQFAKLGTMVISAHMVNSQTYDFLIAVDLRGDKGPKLQPLLGTLFKSIGYKVKEESYFNVNIYNLTDAATNETLSLAMVNNVLVASYNLELLKRGIAQSEQPSVIDQADLVKVRNATSRSNLYSVYINYATFERLLRSYTAETPEMLSGLEEILTFSGMDLQMKDYVDLNGVTHPIDSAASFLNVFHQTGKGEIEVQNVLPNNTAMYASVGASDFGDLYARYKTFLQTQNPKAYRDFEKNEKRVDRLLKIEMDRDFFSWLTEEVVTATVPFEEAGESYAYFALLHFDDLATAQERLDYIAKRIGKTPFKFESMEYQGYTIRYLEVKGLFSVFFKKLFNKIERPHYAIVDDYVVFSNDTSSLMMLIDKYLADEVLAREKDHMDFRREFSSSSNVFACIRPKYLLGSILSELDSEARRDLLKNRNYLLAFPDAGFQMYPEGEMFRTRLFAPFKPVSPGSPSR